MEYLGETTNDKDLATKGYADTHGPSGGGVDSPNMSSIVNPKLEVFSGTSTSSAPHVIESDTDVILATNTSGSAYLRLPPNAAHGKRIIAKSLQGSTNRTITMYPSNDTDGKSVRLIGYATVTNSSASSAACSYYPVEFMCLIDGNIRYWLQISRY